jgi:hypothetical protein
MRSYAFAFLFCALGGASIGCGSDGSNTVEPTGSMQAEPTKFTVELKNVADFKYLKSGTYNTPVGKDGPGPLSTGDRFEITFTAGVGHRLSFADMLGASNDWFFAPDPAGIELYKDGEPVTGDVTDQIHLYDSGTEINQEPGVGADTGPKQSTPEQGEADSDNTVREITGSTMLADGTMFDVPPINEMIRVTLGKTDNEREFKLTIENVSTDATLMTSMGAIPLRISPGVFVVHGMPEALFSLGKPDRGEGIDWIAESGRIMMLGDNAAASSGVATGFSPLVYVLHENGMPLFMTGSADLGQGLERIAESGNIAPLSEALAGKLPDGASMFGKVDMPVDADMPGPIRPGGSFSFTIEARPGDRFSFASMFGASNDWFVGVSDDGVPLFDAGGKAISGDMTSSLVLWDVGTEMSEEPAVGANTGPQQPDPDAGVADTEKNVRMLDTATYGVPMSKHLMFTITPN